MEFSHHGLFIIVFPTVTCQNVFGEKDLLHFLLSLLSPAFSLFFDLTPTVGLGTGC